MVELAIHSCPADAATLSDEELVVHFERCTLDPATFHHAQHVRLAWQLLREGTFDEAAARFTRGLRRFAASLGKETLYHETITWAYLVLIHERMANDGADDFAAFRARNEDLFTWKPSILERYYEKDVLMSDFARRTFVLPRRIA